MDKLEFIKALIEVMTANVIDEITVGQITIKKSIFYRQEEDTVKVPELTEEEELFT